MKNNFPYKKVIGILLLILLGPGLFASKNHSIADNTIQERPLKEVLLEFEEHYQVFFNYQSKLVKDKKVDFAIKSEEAVEAAIKRLLRQTGLNYEIISSKYIVLYADTGQGRKNFRKIRKKINQLDRLERKSDISIRRNQQNPFDRATTIMEAAIEPVIQHNVSGLVTDSNGEPMIGVSILVKGTTLGTVTEIDGRYSIDLEDGTETLVFSYLGYATWEEQVQGRNVINVELQEDVAKLEEIVVIGYGTQRAGDVTSAVTSVKSDEFLVGKIQDASELIRGKVAGLVITKSSGDPNASSNILLRGITTLQGNVNPLVLVDGVPSSITAVAPENIASIDVLKDASAAAIYGTRGANGVILITTKSGRRTENAQVSYNGYVAVSDFYKTADFLSPSDIRRGRTSFSDDGWDTDWLSAITQNGFMHNHSLNITGGTEKTTYSGNVFYRYEDGTIINTNNDQTRIQLDLTHHFLDDLVKVNVNVLKVLQKNTANNASDGGITNVYRQAVIRNPTSPIYEEDTGNYFEEFGRFQYFNPVAMLNELIGENKFERTNLTGNITIEPILNWKTNLLLANNQTNSNSSSYRTSEYFTSFTSGLPGSASKSFGEGNSKFLELTSNYDLNIGRHRLSALAGYSYTYQVSSGFSASNADFPTNSYLYNNIGVGGQLNEGRAGMSSYKSDSKLIGFFGRVSYGFDNRYNLLASLRREGSSKFGDNHKWGVFPAVSAGWTISNEAFMENVDWIDNLKLRAGYGVTGQAPSSSYLSITKYNYDNNYGNYLNEDGDWVAGLQITQNPNPDLRWEKTSEINLGLDFSFFKNRLGGSIDVYSKETTDLLYNYTVPVPPNLYSSTLANVGSIENKGVELMLRATPVSTPDFLWNASVTVTHNRSKLLNLSNDLYETNNFLDVAYAGDPISVPTHRVEIGQEIGNFWGLRSVGVTEEGIWLVEDPNTGEVLEYSTALNTNDYRQYLGNGFPDIYLGFNNTFAYKGFDLGIQMTGQFGFKILNEQRMFYENNSIQYNRLASAADPVYGIAPLSNSQAQAFVSYYLEDGDFLKIDNVTLGYTFTPQFMSSKVSSLRVYCSAQNFLILTNYSGLDPELANFDFFAAGNDFRDKYPTIRSLTFGLNVNFK